MTPLDLDEIARRPTMLYRDEEAFVVLLPAERDALVERARDGVGHGRSELETELWAIIDRTSFAEVPSDIHNAVSRLVHRARVPEMPADVAGTVARLKGVAEHQFEQHYGHVRTPKEQSFLWQAATLIESLERQRREAVAEIAKRNKADNHSFEDFCKAIARAEQAEKDLAKVKRDLEWMTGFRNQAVDEAKTAEFRLAKLGAVVTAQRGSLTWIMLQRETALCGCRPYPGEPRCGWCTARDLAAVKFDEAGIPVAALDRKEP